MRTMRATSLIALAALSFAAVGCSDDDANNAPTEQPTDGGDVEGDDGNGALDGSDIEGDDGNGALDGSDIEGDDGNGALDGSDDGG
jgi:hypothetical protein